MAAELYLGIDTGGTATKYVVTDAEGVAVAEGEVPTDPDSPPATLERLATTVAGELDDRAASRLAGAGLACAGIIHPVTGRLGRSPNLPGWQQRELATEMHAAFGDLPTVVVNDVNAAVYGEYRAGAGRGCRDLVMLALGTGVGGGAVVDGRLLVGTRGGACEFGHTVLDPQGPVCSCGNRGCLESWAGSRALLRRARELGADKSGRPALAALVFDRGEELTTRDLADLAEGGDLATREVFAEAGRRLGQAVGNLINVFDPDRVIIGGGVARAGDLILAPMRETYPPLALAEESARTPVVVAELGPAAAAVGAAWLARERETAG